MWKDLKKRNHLLSKPNHHIILLYRLVQTFSSAYFSTLIKYNFPYHERDFENLKNIRATFSFLLRCHYDKQQIVFVDKKYVGESNFREKNNNFMKFVFVQEREVSKVVDIFICTHNTQNLSHASTNALILKFHFLFTDWIVW